MSTYLRRRVSREVGVYHIYSRVVGGQHLMNEKERNYFIKLLKCLAKFYYVEVRAFIVMSNHFHLLVRENSEVGKAATHKERCQRYQDCFGEDAEPPIGINRNGEFSEDPDGGEERLLNRSISISAFVKELKETFSKWYNDENNRDGCFWSSRFKGPIVFNGASEMVVSAYIESNAQRAGIVARPEDYKWSSLYIRLNDPDDAAQWLYPVYRQDILDNPMDDEPVPFMNLGSLSELEWYRLFVYVAASKERKGTANMDPKIVKEMIRYASALGIAGRFSERIKNFTHGIVIGAARMVEAFQKEGERTNHTARNFFGATWSYASRVLRC